VFCVVVCGCFCWLLFFCIVGGVWSWGLFVFGGVFVIGGLFEIGGVFVTKIFQLPPSCKVITPQKHVTFLRLRYRN